MRAYAAQKRFQKELRKRVNVYSSVTHPYWDFNRYAFFNLSWYIILLPGELYRWIAVRIEVLGATFSGIIATWLIYGGNSTSATIGFTLVLISSFNGNLLQLVRTYNYLEVEGNRYDFLISNIANWTGRNSLERIRQYLDVEHEPVASEDGKPPAYWPSSGSLSVEKLSARYSKDGPEVLKEISFEIKSGERIGVGKHP